MNWGQGRGMWAEYIFKKMGIYDHMGLGFEPLVLCITGSQENHDLSMNEDRKSLPVYPPQAI